MRAAPAAWRRAGRGAAIDVRTALSDGRTADAERGAHTLKGVAGRSSAPELQREAGELEAALRHGDPRTLAPDARENRVHPGASACGHRRFTAARSNRGGTGWPRSIGRRSTTPSRPRLEWLLSQDAVGRSICSPRRSRLSLRAYGERTGEIDGLLKGYRFDALAVLRAAREET